MNKKKMACYQYVVVPGCLSTKGSSSVFLLGHGLSIEERAAFYKQTSTVFIGILLHFTFAANKRASHNRARRQIPLVAMTTT